MSKYSSKDLSITYGGTNLSTYIRTINGVDVEAILADIQAFGDVWPSSFATGVKKMSPITLGGLFDDAASGPDAKFGPSALGTSASLVITWGGTKTTTVTAFVQKYTRTPKLANATEFTVVLMPSGTDTEA